MTRGHRGRSQGVWVAYFDSLGVHAPLHRVQADLYVQALSDMIDWDRSHRVLDFGSGYGFVAALLAPLAREVHVWDPAASMRLATARTTAGLPNVRFCDLTALHSFSPGLHPSPPLGPLDLILVNSVTQYMGPGELWGWLGHWRAMLAPGGRVILSDLIPSGHRGRSDMVDLLRLGASYGSPIRGVRDALGGFSRYWRAQRAAPLVPIDPQHLAQRAADAGFDMRVLSHNLTHFRTRWTAILLPRTEQARGA